jgi:putative salt-induced outer membrane protein YdiY
VGRVSTPRSTSTLVALAGVLAVVTARAQAQPAAIEQHTVGHAEQPPDDDTTSLAASLGGTLNTGNTRSWQLTTGSDFKLVRSQHSFGANAAFAYGRADVADDGTDAFQDTVKNLNAKLRYDYFLTDYDALFIAALFRWDEFAGLDARVSGQVGYLRVFFKAPKHRLWGEIGYDLTYDNYHPDPLPNPDFDPVMPVAGVPEFLDGSDVVHSVRVFVGYENEINEAITYVGGVEGLFNVEETDDVRVNLDNALRSSIAGNFKLELKFSLKYDNVPVPGSRKTDTATVISVLYQLI